MFMKKIFSLSLIATILLGINAADARTGHNKDLSTLSANTAKTIAEAAPKSGSAKNLTSPGPGDTSGNNSPIHFYRPKKKRYINLEDVFVGVGGSYMQNAGSNNIPYHTGLGLNGCYGVPLINKYLLFEYNNNLEFLFSPDLNWYSNAFSLPKSKLPGLAWGVDDEFSIDLQVVIAGSRNLSFTAGPLAGARLTNLPSLEYNKRLYHVSVPISLSYGFKTNLFIGEKIYCYAQYSNIVAGNLTSYASQVAGDEQQYTKRMPVNFGSFRVGVGYVLKPWW